MRPRLFLPTLLLAVGSCSSPPNPPTVDESFKRPANMPDALELQACKSELQNTRILAKESRREASRSVAALERRREDDAHSGRNVVYAVLFAFGSSRFTLPDADARRLVAAARDAPMIVLRGRTDGTSDAPAEGRIARQRTAAVQELLVRAGIEPSRIRATWQPTGDHAADNASAGGRALNRRVEVEIYRAAPQFVALGGGSAP